MFTPVTRTRSGRETSRTYVRDEGWLYLGVVNVATYVGIRDPGTNATAHHLQK